MDAVADESDTTNNCSAPARVMVVEPQQPEGVPSVRISSTGSAVTEGMAAQFGVTATLPPTADLDVCRRHPDHRSGSGAGHRRAPDLNGSGGVAPLDM